MNETLLCESIWVLDNKTVMAQHVDYYHPKMMYGHEEVLYEEINAAELYGIIRTSLGGLVFVADAEGEVCVCVFGVRGGTDGSLDDLYYYIEEDEFRILLNHFLTDTLDPAEAGDLEHLRLMEDHPAGQITDCRFVRPVHNWAKEGF